MNEIARCNCEPDVYHDGSVGHEDDCAIYPWCPHEMGYVCTIPCGCDCAGCVKLLLEHAEDWGTARKHECGGFEERRHLGCPFLPTAVELGREEAVESWVIGAAHRAGLEGLSRGVAQAIIRELRDVYGEDLFRERRT